MSLTMLIGLCLCTGGASSDLQDPEGLSFSGEPSPVREGGLPSEESSGAAYRASALVLNQHTFAGNALRPQGDHVSNWVVLFCVDWWEDCQSILPSYGELGAGWEAQLNQAVLTSRVRFARVDCAADKVLCNEQGVEMYPTVQRYSQGERVAVWLPPEGRGKSREEDARSLAAWLRGQLEAAGERAEGGRPQRAPGQDFRVDIALVAATIALNWWAFAWEGDKKLSHAGQSSGAAAEPSAQLLPESWARDRPSIDL